MDTAQPTPTTIDDYIAAYPPDVQAILHQLRATIHEAAPDVAEGMSYKMPTFNLGGKYLVYFAAFKNHVSLYGAPRGNPAFPEDLSAYESGQGTLKFPYNKPIPYELIAKIARFRAEENRAGAAAKRKKK